MTFPAIIAWLMTNGGTIIAAGVDLAAIGRQLWTLFHGTNGTITKEAFNAFIDKALGDKAELLAIIDAAKAEL